MGELKHGPPQSTKSTSLNLVKSLSLGVPESTNSAVAGESPI